MSLNVSADLVPLGGGAWPTHTDIWGKGGYRAVLDNTARDAITTLRRSEGMLVYVIGTGNTYRLGAGLTNADWALQSSGAITAGNGLTGTTSLAVLANGSTLDVSASGVKVATGGITGNELAAASVNLAGAKVTGSLPGTSVTPDFGTQNLQTTGFVTIGSPAATIGDLRVKNGFSIVARDSTNTANATLIQFPSGDSLVLGANVYTTIINGSILSFRAGNVVCGTVDTSFWTIYSGGVRFLKSVTAPSLTQENEVANSVNGQKTTIRAQNSTGTTTTGGPIDIGPGSGTSAGGLGRLISGSLAARYSWNDTGHAFFGASLAAQPARVGQLTDSIGVSPSGTIGNVGGAFNQTTLNDIHASLLAKINALETIIHNAGLSA